MTSSLFSWPFATSYTTSVLIQYLLPASSARKDGCWLKAGKTELTASRTTASLNFMDSPSKSSRGPRALRLESSPQFGEPGRIGYPLDRIGIVSKLFIDRHRRGEAEFRIASRFALLQVRRKIGWIRFPADFPFGHAGKPGESVVRAHLHVVKTVLAITPGPEDQHRIWIGVHHVVRPHGSHND